jgi:hypothetical protein
MPNTFTITLAGQDITPYVQFLPDPSDNTISWPNAQPFQIDATLGQGAGNSGGNSGRAATATFLAKLGPIGTAVGAGTIVTRPTLVRQGEVIITDRTGVVVFGGYAGGLADASNRTQVATQISCYDYWQQLAHITINEVFDGISDIAAIRQLITSYAPWVDLSLLPAYASTTLLGQVWRNKTLQWALQHIADISGNQVYIAPNRRFIYNSPTQALAAPFTLSDSPDNSTSFPFQIESVVVDDTAIINRVTFYGGKQPTPDFAQDVSTQANGSNKVFVLAYYPRKSSNGLVIVTVNGSDLVVGYSLGTGTQNTLKSQGGSCDVLLDPSARTMTFDVAPAGGASVICTYRYQLPLIIQLTEENSHAFYGQYYDATLSDETVVDSATAIQRCRVLLLEQAYGLTTVKLYCWKGGLQQGQQLLLTDTVRGINQVFIIQEVITTAISPTTARYEVTLGAWNWNLVDVLQSVAQRTALTDQTEIETITPTQVQVNTVVSAVLSIALNPSTRTMGGYHPGAGLGMYPGLSSI